MSTQGHDTEDTEDMVQFLHELGRKHIHYKAKPLYFDVSNYISNVILIQLSGAAFVDTSINTSWFVKHS